MADSAEAEPPPDIRLQTHSQPVGDEGGERDSGEDVSRQLVISGGDAGEARIRTGRSSREWALEIIKRSDTAKGFELLSRRRAVERTFAWINRNRCLEKDFEATIESSIAWLQLASVQLMLCHLANV